ncbi:exonuclease domain-containing protein [Paenibacillus flagellatus]|uniref:DNA polymerase III subunit epsilon n=1 Tax=Paenibacillus flagellatus TaxID=2211139 RepID=A0A2V5KW37_9BACL|nr:exonuclease domain-containing protein [Paenibacillus flagellatus]PYI56457.1 DNA polymerase III subunit epsilon [Paenibacillus flagellatus]
MRKLWHLYKQGGITPAVASMFDSQNAQHMAFIRSVMKEQRKNSMYDIPLQKLETVVFDLETTGFSPYSGDEIISIGAVGMTGDLVLTEQSYYSLARPEKAIPNDVVRLTGITNEEAAQAPELITVLKQFLEFVNHRVLVVHGSGHDKHFLNSALWKTSKVNLSHRFIDCLIMAQRLEPKRSSYDLDSLLRDYGIAIEGRHHALGDANMTAQLWKCLLNEALRRDIGTLGDLYDFLSR